MGKLYSAISILSALLLWSVGAYAQSSDTKTLLLMQGNIFDAMPSNAGRLQYFTFQADVTQSGSTPESSGRILRIKCLADCPSHWEYSERVDNYPLSIMMLSDATNQLIFTSVTGSAYGVNVYLLAPDGAREVFEGGSKDPPEIRPNPKDGSAIITTDDAFWDSSGKRIRDQIIWKWNGEKYEEDK
jgi:hypothetical protein